MVVVAKGCRSATRRQGWQLKSAGGQSSSCLSAWMRAATPRWSEQIHALLSVTCSRASCRRPTLIFISQCITITCLLTTCNIFLPLRPLPLRPLPLAPCTLSQGIHFSQFICPYAMTTHSTPAERHAAHSPQGQDPATPTGASVVASLLNRGQDASTPRHWTPALRWEELRSLRRRPA